jgi:hypothetical protein
VVILQLLDAICGEIFVECSPANFELVNDIADERVIFDVLKHSFSVFDVCSFIAFGLPPRRPRFAAALRPVRVFSTINSRCNSSKAAVIRKNKFPSEAGQTHEACESLCPV